MINRYANESLPDLTAAMSGFRAVVSAPRSYVPTPVRAAARPAAPARAAAAAPPAPPSPPAKRRPLEEIERDLEALERRLRREHPEAARELDRQAGIQPRQLDAKSAARIEAKRALDLKMGLIVPTNGVVSTQYKLTLGTTKNLAEIAAAKPASKPAKPVQRAAQIPEAAAKLRLRMGIVAATDGVLSTPFRLSLGVP